MIFYAISGYEKVDKSREKPLVLSTPEWWNWQTRRTQNPVTLAVMRVQAPPPAFIAAKKVDSYFTGPSLKAEEQLQCLSDLFREYFGGEKIPGHFLVDLPQGGVGMNGRYQG